MIHFVLNELVDSQQSLPLALRLHSSHGWSNLNLLVHPSSLALLPSFSSSLSTSLPPPSFPPSLLPFLLPSLSLVILLHSRRHVKFDAHLSGAAEQGGQRDRGTGGTSFCLVETTWLELTQQSIIHHTMFTTWKVTLPNVRGIIWYWVTNSLTEAALEIITWMSFLPYQKPQLFNQGLFLWCIWQPTLSHSPPDVANIKELGFLL